MTLLLKILRVLLSSVVERFRTQSILMSSSALVLVVASRAL